MASWAEDIKKTRETKNYVKLTEPAHRQPLARSSQDARSYDIVSFADTTTKTATAGASKKSISASASASASATEKLSRNEKEVTKASAAEHVQRGMQRAFKHSYTAYDAVTHKPAYGISDDTAAAMYPPERQTGPRKIGRFHSQTFDLISNTALRGHEAEFDAEQKAMSEHRVRYAPRQRQTDIVNHRFKKDHEERAAKQAAETRAKLLARQKPTDFNPVAQKWCDADVEAKAAAAAAAKQDGVRDAVKNHTYKVSNLVRYSEGHAVDYLTGKVHNPEFLLEINKGKARGMMQRTKLRQEFEHRRDADEAIRDANVQLVLQRHHPSKKPERAGGEKVPSTLARLEAATRSKPAVTSEVYLAEGPRTTQERVLSVKPSEIAAAANTYEGRRMLLLPTLEKAAGRPLQRSELIASLHKPGASSSAASTPASTPAK